MSVRRLIVSVCVSGTIYQTWGPEWAQSHFPKGNVLLFVYLLIITIGVLLCFIIHDDDVLVVHLVATILLFEYLNTSSCF